MLRIYSHHIYTKICRKIFGQAQLSRLKPQLKLSLSSIFAVRPESAIRHPEKYNFQSYTSPSYNP